MPSTTITQIGATLMPPDSTVSRSSAGHAATRLRSRLFVGPVVAIGGVQLLAAMDGPVAIFALPVMQRELGLSDAGITWVVTAYMLTFGGLILLGGRLGDVFGGRRTFIAGVALFTAASVLCGIAWDGGSLIVARLLHGAAAAIVTPTCMSLMATTFPKGPTRNAAAAAFGALASVGVIMGLVVGGALAGVSWRLAFLVNVPIGLLVIHLARTTLQESRTESAELDVAGAVLATLGCGAVVLGLSAAPEQGWTSATMVGSGVVAVVCFALFAVVERTARNPIVPLRLFSDRSLLATFAAMSLVRGVGFTLAVLIAVYVQIVLGYSPLRAGVSFIPFAVAIAIGVVVSARIVTWFSPRVVVIAGSTVMACAIACGAGLLDPGVPYFPHLVVPIAVGAFGLGLVGVPLGLSLITGVGVDRIGPASAVAVMLQSLAGPLILVAIQAVIVAHTLRSGGAVGSGRAFDATQLDALDAGYGYGLVGLAAVVVLLGAVATFIGYTAQQVAHAQREKSARSGSTEL